MSFMFHPYPYVDANAVNPVNSPQEDTVVFGALPVAKRIAKAVGEGKKRIGIDGYAGVEFEVIRQLLAAQMAPLNARIVPVQELLKPAQYLREMLAPSLPMDRDIDPVLLYGKRIERRYEDVCEPDRLAELNRDI